MNKDYVVFKKCPFSPTRANCQEQFCELWRDNHCSLFLFAVDVGIMRSILQSLARLAVPEVECDRDS